MGGRSPERLKERPHCDLGGTPFALYRARKGAQQRHRGGRRCTEPASSQTPNFPAALVDLGSRTGVLRQYFPRRTDLSGYTQSDLDKVALRLNQRPRKTLPDAVRRERSAVPRRRFQRGCIRKVGQSWILYFYRDEDRDGVIRRMQVSQRLGPTRGISLRAASALAQPIIDTVNNQTEIPVKGKGITLAELSRSGARWLCPP